MSSFKDKNAETLLALGNNVTTVLGPGATNPYGVPQASVTALLAADAALGAAINAQKAAEIAAKTATAQKAAKRVAVAAALGAIQATADANPAVTNEMLVALGFSPRRGGAKPQPKVPATVTGLSADPSANGSVKLKWGRNGNAPTTMFVVETSADGAAWTFLKTTTRCSYLAEGFVPGAAAFFRVTATTSVAASLPSLPVAIYAPAPATVQLRVA